MLPLALQIVFITIFIDLINLLNRNKCVCKGPLIHGSKVMNHLRTKCCPGVPQSLGSPQQVNHSSQGTFEQGVERRITNVLTRLVMNEGR